MTRPQKLSPAAVCSNSGSHSGSFPLSGARYNLPGPCKLPFDTLDRPSGLCDPPQPAEAATRGLSSSLLLPQLPRRASSFSQSALDQHLVASSNMSSLNCSALSSSALGNELPKNIGGLQSMKEGNKETLDLAKMESNEKYSQWQSIGTKGSEPLRTPLPAYARDPREARSLAKTAHQR